MLVIEEMEKQRSIISAWLASKSKPVQDQLLAELGQTMHASIEVPVEGVIEQLAAGLMAACAEDLGLTTLELSGLLKTPRQDALSGLITVIRKTS